MNNILSGLLPGLLLVALTLSQSVQATPESGGSLLLATEQGGATAPLLSTEVSIDIVAMTARVKVSQRFRNPGQHWSEGIYVFPLPEDAAVDRLRMWVGERVIEGEIQDRSEARKTYEKAKQAGQRSSLVEQQRANIFTTSIANIDPGAEIRVDIEYQQAVGYRDGVFRLRFPMVVGPRYIPGRSPVRARSTITGDFGASRRPSGKACKGAHTRCMQPFAQRSRAGWIGVPKSPVIVERALSPIAEQVTLSGGWARDTDQVPDASRITPPVQTPEQGAIKPVTLDIRLSPGLPLADVNSSYHPVRIERQGDAYRIQLQEGPVPADRDFELVWTPQSGHAPRAALFTEEKDGLTYALLMLTPPGADTLERQTVPRDLSFVIDTSGSMYGDSIEQARQALLFALQGLSADDRFNIIEFNSEASRLFPDLSPAGPENLARARAWVDRLQADGGTEMAPALKLALPTLPSQTPGRLHQVIFLTDGAVGNEAALLRLIHKRLGDSRLFTVGIGSAPNSWFMRKAAEFGRGSFTYIGKPDEVLDKMTTLLRRLQYPALTDLSLELPDGIAAEVYPAPLPDLYLGEPLQIALRLPKLPDTLVLNGRFGQRPWRSELRLDSPQSGDGISTLWARRRIAALMDDLHRSQQTERRTGIREAVVKTALNHHLVSKFTSLVAVDKTPARPADQALPSHPMKTMLPKGWSHSKVFGLAQTATPAQLQLLIGLGLLLTAGLARRMTRRAARRSTQRQPAR